MRLSRQIIGAAPFTQFRGREVFPGADLRTRAELEAIVRRKAATIYHPAGTCGRGRDAAPELLLAAAGSASQPV
jgi:choline dehydrogenase